LGIRAVWWGWALGHFALTWENISPKHSTELTSFSWSDLNVRVDTETICAVAFTQIADSKFEATEERGVKYAIRLPAKGNLLRDIEELLTRPTGRLSYQPIVWYKGFLCQAASWKTARRVVTKVEFHAGALFPRVGFIVTNLEAPSPSGRAVL
jgi:hypothetical protein